MKVIKAADGTSRTPDGVLLLTNDEIAELAGVSRETINHYNVARLRGSGRHSAGSPAPIPPPVAREKRSVERGDGIPVAVWKQLWRQDDIVQWIEKRKKESA